MDNNRLEKRMADTLVETTTDKTGETVLIKLANPIGGSPVIPFYLRHFSELIDNGHAHPIIVGTNKHKAMYAEINGEVAGHIVFEILDDPYKTAWITFSVIENNFRRRGLYDILHKNFEKHVKTTGSLKIASLVHVNNTVRQASCAKVGMEPVFYRMEKQL
jgi:hypothetical protein